MIASIAAQSIAVPGVAAPEIDGADSQSPKSTALAMAPDRLLGIIQTAVSRLTSLQQGGEQSSQALESAMAKLTIASEALRIGGGLADIMAEMLRLQGKQTDQTTQLAKGQIQDKFKKLQAQVQQQLEQIKKRIEASKKSGFWGSFMKIFKVIATAITAVAAVVSGNPLLLVAAALTIAAMVTGMASNSEAAGWVSFGLGIAAAVCSLGACATNPNIPGLSKLADLIKVANVSGKVKAGIDIGSAAANAGAAGGAIGKGMADSDVLEAQANLAELRAWGKRLLKGAEEDRELIRVLVEAEDRAVELVHKIINTDSGVQDAAMAGA